MARTLFLMLLSLQVFGLTLVSDGQSRHEILIGPEALPITRAAAEDLQLYLRKSTGIELPIRVAKALGDQPAILVGDQPASRALGVTMEGVAPEGFRIRTVGENLIIAGRDTAGSANSVHWRNAPQAGTWNGVSTFLQEQLGIRWFFPGEIGEVIPPHQILDLPDMDQTGAPSMIYRRMSYLYDSQSPPEKVAEANLWMRRNRLGWSTIWQGQHSWLLYLKAEDLYDQHPDWFALVDGRRLKQSPHGAQICTTNSELLDYFAQFIINYSRENGGVMFTLSPNDGGGHCECANCRALDVEHYPDGTPVLTDRYLTYCNEIAKRVNKVLPEQTFGFYAYSFYLQPPKRVKHLNPNVHVMSVLNDTGLLYYREDSRRHHLQEILQPWHEVVSRLFFYDHPEGNGNLELPAFNARNIAWLYDDLRAATITGFSMNNATSWAATGLNNYLYASLAWDGDADGMDVYQQALLACYGSKAGPRVGQYFAAVERRLSSLANQAPLNENRAMGVVQRFPGLLATAYPGLAAEGMPLLQQALAAAEDDGQRARIQLLITNLEYTDLTVRLYQQGSSIVGASKPELDAILATRELARQHDAFLTEHDQTLQVNASRVRGVADAYNLPLKPGVYDYLVTSLQKPRVTHAWHVDLPPVLDGDLSDAAWQGHDSIRIELDKDDARRHPVGANAWIVRDATHLYIAIACEEPEVASLADTVTQHDGPVWNENDIEFFFDPGATGKDFRQLLVNSLGTLADFQRHDGVTGDWTSQAKAATKRLSKSWTLELAIPLAALSDSPIKPGDIWGFNACRVRPLAEPRAYTCWSPTFGGFPTPERFGRLIWH